MFDWLRTLTIEELSRNLVYQIVGAVVLFAGAVVLKKTGIFVKLSTTRLSRRIKQAAFHRVRQNLRSHAALLRWLHRDSSISLASTSMMASVLCLAILMMIMGFTASSGEWMFIALRQTANLLTDEQVKHIEPDLLRKALEERADSVEIATLDASELRSIISAYALKKSEAFSGARPVLIGFLVFFPFLNAIAYYFLLRELYCHFVTRLTFKTQIRRERRERLRRASRPSKG